MSLDQEILFRRWYTQELFKWKKMCLKKSIKPWNLLIFTKLVLNKNSFVYRYRYRYMLMTRTIHVIKWKKGINIWNKSIQIAYGILWLSCYVLPNIFSRIWVMFLLIKWAKNSAVTWKKISFRTITEIIHVNVYTLAQLNCARIWPTFATIVIQHEKRVNYWLLNTA